MTFTESVSFDLQPLDTSSLKSPTSFPHPFSPQTQFVSYCLRQLFWLQDFDNLGELEEAILDEDVYGIFNSNTEEVGKALRPFVTGNSHSRDGQETREREGVEVYFVPVLEAVKDGYRKTKRTVVKINLLSTWRGVG